ncbi:thimet oligopeptidase-like protein [Neoconidiobolus thromboides FSU 785]|nr:thimet oligopeptidase-like protein [Neoconidiobolus thromboides FSU 785]
MTGIDIQQPQSIKPSKVSEVEGIRLRFDIDVEDLQNLSEELIAIGRKEYDAIANLKAEECNFDTVFKRLAELETWYGTYKSIVYMPQHVHTDKALREESSKLEHKLSEFEIEVSMREDFYEAVKNAQRNIDVSKLNSEDQKFIEKTVLEFKRNGLDLPKDKREELKTILNKLSELSIVFAKTIAEDETEIELTREELDGLPEDFINNLKQKKNDNGQQVYLLTMKYPDVVPTLENAKLSSTRQKVEKVYNSRCSSNIEVLEQALQLRLKAANLLGYKNHADFKLELKMAKKADAVNKFLNDLRDTLTTYGKQELPELLQLKKTFEAEANEIHSYDTSYLKNQLLKNKFKVDHQKIKEYYPLDQVTEKMLELYQKVLNLKFETIENNFSWNLDTPQDIKLIKVSDGTTQELMGYFYLDLFPRPGKYSHAACFPIQSGAQLSNGTRQVPVAAMVANFTKPTTSSPSLLRHSEIVTYFHELGHVMHTICSKTKYSRFHGTNVEGDFVEAPSQMLENWCWDKKILSYLSSHYESNDKIPEELIDSLIDSKNVGSGLFYLRQLLFAIFDLKIHSIETDERLNINELFLNLKKEISLVSGQPDTCFVATFGHLMGGYDAGYYGYLWSEVFSADMFASKFKSLDDIAGPKVGLSYRNEILLPGASKDAIDMLTSFLDREPTNEAFLESIKPKL